MTTLPRFDDSKDPRLFDADMRIEQELSRILQRGRWTPVVKGGTTPGTYETSEAIGKYWLLCNKLVFIEFRITLAGIITGGGVGNLEIGGLPYRIGTDSFPRGPAYHTGYDTAATTHTIWSKSTTDEKALVLREVNDNAAFGSGAIGGVAINDAFGGSLFYEIA